MKQVTLKVSNCSVAQWSTLLLELNLMSKSWTKFGPKIELQARSVERILAHGTSNKPQASGRKRHNMALFR
jgi:hypothetical protein